MKSGEYDGSGRRLFRNPPSGNSKPMGTSLLGHPVIPLNMVKWIGIRSKHILETKRIECTYSKVLRIKVTHTMIPRLITSWSKIHFCYRTRSRWWMLLLLTKWRRWRKKKMGPPRPCSSRSGSRYSMSRTCGPRDIISLVIPKVGDNMYIIGFNSTIW